MAKEFSIFEASYEGITLIEAGAGTGKTYNIASLYVRAIIEKNLLPSNILVLTYTEAATAELKQRLKKRISESVQVLEGKAFEDPFLAELPNRYPREVVSQLKKALYSFDEAFISTIHGFCQRLLKEFSLEFEVNPSFEILPDESELLQDTVDVFWRETFKPSTDPFQTALQKSLATKDIFPEKLLSHIKIALEKPYAKLVPQVKPINEFRSELDTLQKASSVLKKVWKKDSVSLKEIVWSDVLNGNKYRNRKILFEDISNWVNTFEAPDSPPDNLFKFGRYLPEQGLRKNQSVPELEVFDQVDLFLEAYEAFTQIEIAYYTEAIQTIIEQFRVRKNKIGVLSYNDLLTKVWEGFQRKPELVNRIKGRFPVGLIDEFQDTDPIQYEIFRALFSKESRSSLFLIGDPKQAIYSFRGADLNTYLKAKLEVTEGKRFTLSNNYRSSKKLIESVNAFFKYSQRPFLIEELSFVEAKFPEQKQEEGTGLDSNSLDSMKLISFSAKDKKADQIRNEIADSIASEIIQLLGSEVIFKGKRITEKDIAILTNSHTQAHLIQQVLKSRGLKSIIKSKESVYNTQVATELYLVLKAVGDPGNEPGLRSALATELLGYTSNDLVLLAEDYTTWNSIVNTFRGLNSTWVDKGFSDFSSELVRVLNLEKRIVRLPDSERKWTDFYHIIELLQKANSTSNYGINGLLGFLRRKINGIDGTVSDEEVIRLESDAGLLQIVTMHASKGLEFPVVFCPFLWETRKRKVSSSFSFTKAQNTFIDLGSETSKRNEHLKFLEEEECAESIRLAYVALTRAESLCFVYVDKDWKNRSALTHLIKQNEAFERSVSENLVDITNSDIRIDDSIFEGIESENESIAEPQNFTRTGLDKYPKLTSFSSLSGTNGQTELSSDFGYDYDEVELNRSSDLITEKDIFSLPKGKQTGTLLHSIFEEIDFQNPEHHPSLISQKLDAFGFDMDWTPVLQQLVNGALSHSLVEGIALDQIALENRLIEMEFHFPVSEINGDGVLNIIRDDTTNAKHSISGFMKGFIDLVFEKRGKYYILDYKSNHLGNSFEDYSTSSLNEEILHSQYDLQYHIYTLALKKFLELKLPKFDYETQFGGVFYLFLRGVNPSAPGSGVYFSKPSISVIQKLEKYLMKKVHD